MKIITTIAIVLIVIILGVFYFASDKSEFEDSAILNEEVSVIDNSLVDGWSTYNSEEHGFEFRYPSEWSVPTISAWEDINEFALEGKACDLSDNLLDLLETCLGNTNVEEKMSNNTTFYIVPMVWQENGSENKVMYVYFMNNDAVYKVVFQGLNDIPEVASLISQILTTFSLR